MFIKNVKKCENENYNNNFNNCGCRKRWHIKGIVCKLRAINLESGTLSLVPLFTKLTKTQNIAVIPFEMTTEIPFDSVRK